VATPVGVRRRVHLEAAEAVCVGDSIGVADVLPLLAALVDKSLVNVEERRGETRYGLLETIRQYGEEKLQAAGEAMALARATATGTWPRRRRSSGACAGRSPKRGWRGWTASCRISAPRWT